MKKTWMAAVLAAALLCGSSAMAEQPGLAGTMAGMQVGEWKVDQVDMKYPVLTEGSALQRARVNAAIETEVARFQKSIEKQNETGSVQGWVNWLGAYRDDNWVSFVLLESTYYKGAAHPTTKVLGMSFDKMGYRVTRPEALMMIPRRTPEEIQSEVEKQAAARGIQLFPEKYRTLTGWPEEWFLGTDGHVHFIFQQYEIAPYAAGWIAVDAGINQ